MKIYYFLNDIEYNNYKFFIQKLELLKKWKTGKDLIQEYFYKIWENNQGRINFWFFLDAMIFVDSIAEKYKLTYTELLNKIEWVHYDRNFYVYNLDIYISDEKFSNYKKVNSNELVYFVTSRDVWLNPFFLVLYKLAELQKNIIVIRPNKRKWWIYNDDKIFNISKLYSNDEFPIWKVIIPFLLNKDINSIDQFLRDVKKKIWNAVVIKKNSSEFWQWVKMLKLLQYKSEDRIEYLKMKFFDNSINSTSSIFIVPFYEIKKEFRIYYLYNYEKDVCEIYSVKNRRNNFDGNIFEKIDIEIDINVHVDWSYFSSSEFTENKRYFDFINNITKQLWYDRGVIEIIETEKDELIFSEINTLWAVLMFPEDQDNMIEYRKKVWKNQFD